LTAESAEYAELLIDFLRALCVLSGKKFLMVFSVVSVNSVVSYFLRKRETLRVRRV
jgi:hypothetical protein